MEETEKKEHVLTGRVRGFLTQQTEDGWMAQLWYDTSASWPLVIIECELENAQVLAELEEVEGEDGKWRTTGRVLTVKEGLAIQEPVFRALKEMNKDAAALKLTEWSTKWAMKTLVQYGLAGSLSKG